ncbi:bifunctional phosphopantothenoylcysteine decarboxylase/phosphopantothenate--cysteine ligase CoaBC [Antarcticirhabdus aurantiaca]|uniref:Bifunctional phosphopantothenoylcysteine decarboxylase/phosphopantothenate--cysteine ligase CoaBC n=1 Tax=Antarcticirhabdus aurantiaca TaxID=2606717 RepID=A0ACD4NLU8_9HYPH|nr:bifunctional phosphopantothenoylcysteine decarboxylase/phosphopantothenate--cysteine ligase CoaBC [Antarcticirhabdus aurantiaca]WAJ27758.1 bifunctional phosphopantothenoylcysteine decarboxylase/phosphopantothenate--cysteine ligase CoaBC [Jeongeuplla avenae]
MTTLQSKRVLLVVGGGIAAYKALDLVRRLRERGAIVVPVMTRGAAEFVTPLSLGALAAAKVYSDLFSRDDEHDVGHIRLARNCDAVIVAPATADRMAKMAAGIADDLAGAILLATRAPVLLAPAMNPAMWSHPATRRSLDRLTSDGIRFVGPDAGEMAESGEAGLGRMAEPLAIVAALEALLAGPADGPLAGRTALVTSGPTHEPIDPVRYIANRSSGRQGHAIAAALARLGAAVRLVSGPVAIPDPPGVETVHVETAREMLAAVEARLPVDLAVFVAAVADWRTESQAPTKLKKRPGAEPEPLRLTLNPDILKTVGTGSRRPRLVVGFAAETADLLANAGVKLAAKGADMIVANDVSAEGGVMGGNANTVHLVTAQGVETWETMAKDAVAEKLAQRLAAMLADKDRP